MAEGGALREVLALFSIDVDGKELEKADEQVKGFIGKLESVAKIVAGAFAFGAVKEFVSAQVETALTLERTSIRLGLATEDIEAFDLAAGSAGVSAEAMNAGLQRLTRTMAEGLKAGSEQAQLFQKLGIQLKDDQGPRSSADVFQDLAEKISQTDEATKRAEIGRAIFGRGYAELLPILDKGRQGFEDARKEMAELGGPTSKEFIENAKQVEEAQVRIKFASNNLSQAIAGQLLPGFAKGIEYLVGLTKEAIAFTKETHILTTGLEALGVIGAYKASVGIVGLLQKFELLQPTIGGSIAKMWEFAAPILGLAAAYLIFDDLFTLMTGGKSIIGDVADALFGLGAAEEVAHNLREAWAEFKDTLKDVGEVLGNVATMLAQLPTLTLGVSGDPNEPSPDIPGLEEKKAAAKREFDRALQNIVAPTGAPKKSLANPSYNPMANRITPGTAAELYKSGWQGPIDYGYNPPSPGAASAGATVVNQHMENHLEFHGPADPQAVKKAVGEGVATPAQRAYSQAKTTVQKS